MSAATISQTVRVREPGRIEIRSSELHPGDVAQVTILVQAPAGTATPATLTEDRLAALDALQRSLNLDAASADAWVRRVRDERHANRLAGPSEPRP